MIEQPQDPIHGHEQLGEHIDDEDTASPFREAALIQAEYIDRLLGFLAESKSPRVAIWAAIYASDSGHCEGISISDRASRIRISTQGLSKEIKRFQDIAGLEPSNYMYKK